MIVYIDQLFAVNFITDCLLLYISCGIAGRRNKWKIALASVFGALYAAFMYVPKVNFLYSPPFRVFFMVIMVWISVGAKSAVSLIKGVLSFASVCLFTGGGVFSVLLMSGFKLSEIKNNSIPVFNISTPLLLVVFCGVLYITRFFIHHMSRSAKEKRKTVKLEIAKNGRKIKILGLIDTGCTLLEPRRRVPVIIVDYHMADRFLKDISEVCMIPYSTVDNSGTFLGFYPDYVKIGDKITRDVAVAVCYTDAMSEKQYSAIINSEILKEEICVA